MSIEECDGDSVRQRIGDGWCFCEKTKLSVNTNFKRILSQMQDNVVVRRVVAIEESIASPTLGINGANGR